MAEKKVMLGKYFDRWQERDFSDDGSRFRCYRLSAGGHDIELSYLKDSDGEYFLDAHLNELFDYELVNMDKDYFELYERACSIGGQFNGCRQISDEDLAQFKDALIAIIHEAVAYKVPTPTIYHNPLDNSYMAKCYSRPYSWHKENEITEKWTICHPSHLDKFIIKHLVVAD